MLTKSRVAGFKIGDEKEPRQKRDVEATGEADEQTGD